MLRIEWHLAWDGIDMDRWCATCIMLKVTPAQVNRLATPCALGLVWDFMRSHYEREARAIAKKETHRWYLTQVLMGKPYGARTIFSVYSEFSDSACEVRRWWRL